MPKRNDEALRLDERNHVERPLLDQLRGLGWTVMNYGNYGDTLLFTPFPRRLMLGACLGSPASSYPASRTL
ncbi:MAG TPA: hypothetical protein DIW77_02265 [Chromatiaceae bacterium]|jgi:hypothetical protein|nr:MAG: hypothetical protein N838_26175 [Thiohalocapsa sp. PB-PSB1]HCS88904.1 hypothetical protein [Chromatiaceae bacterium]